MQRRTPNILWTIQRIPKGDNDTCLINNHRFAQRDQVNIRNANAQKPVSSADKKMWM